MTFAECVLHCFENKELLSGFNRLWGCSLGADRRAPIERTIDDVTGHQPVAVDEAEAVLFMEFVWEYVWARLPPESFSTPCDPVG